MTRSLAYLALRIIFSPVIFAVALYASWNDRHIPRHSRSSGLYLDR